jgi:hypothetical protein
MASRAMTELMPRYANYVWNRLMVVSAEDCSEMVTHEVVGLYDAWTKVVTDTKPDTRPGKRGRDIFLAKAIVLLAKSKHSRDADELLLLVADRIPDDEFDAAIDQCEAVAVDDADWQVPDYVFDVHTQRGKKRGRTRKQFIRDEHDALAESSTIFTNFDEMAASDTYVQPELEWPS